MEETPWLRLRRLVDERRHVIGMTLAQIQAAGGPSPKWVNKLTGLSGEPTPRMRRSMLALDGAMGWEPDSSWRIASGELTEPALAPDPVGEFAQVLARHIRKLPPDDQRRAIREVLDSLDQWSRNLD